MTSYETRSQSKPHERSSQDQYKQWEDQNTYYHQDQKSCTSTPTYQAHLTNPSSISTQDILQTVYSCIDSPKLIPKRRTKSINLLTKKDTSQLVHSKYSEIHPFYLMPIKDLPEELQTNYFTSRRKSTLSLPHEFLPCIEYQIPSYVTTSVESIRRMIGELGPGNNISSQRMLETRCTSRTQMEPSSNVPYISSLASQDTPQPYKPNFSIPSNMISTTSKRTNWTFAQPELSHLRLDSTDLYIPRTSLPKLPGFSSLQEDGGK